MYYRVLAKCGHVGRNNYIEKYFYLEATSGKEAALKVRYMPRVKHDRKDAILSVEAISYETYRCGVREHNRDQYFRVKNSTEQRLTSAVDIDEIKKERREKDLRKARNIGYIIKRQRIIDRHYRKMLLEAANG